MKSFYATFTTAGGYDREKDEAKKLLKIGEKYKIVGGWVQSFSSGFYLEGFPGESFNTCMFDYDEGAWEFISEGSEDKYV